VELVVARYKDILDKVAIDKDTNDKVINSQRNDVHDGRQ